MKNVDITAFDNVSVLKFYSTVMEELQRRGIIRSTNNPIADLSEYLAAGALSLKRMPKSTKGYDAVDDRGTKYEIKGRRPTEKNPSRQLSALRGLDKKHFDYLVGVLFDDALAVRRACVIPHSIVLQESTFRSHPNAWVFHLRDSVWEMRGVRDVTEELRREMANQAL